MPPNSTINNSSTLNETQHFETVPQIDTEALETFAVDTSTPEFSFVDRTTIVGETHIRLQSSDLYDGFFKVYLKRADLVVIEFSNEQNPYYKNLSTLPSFMDLAELHALKENTPLHILDNRIPNRADMYRSGDMNMSPKDTKIVNLFTTLDKALFVDQDKLHENFLFIIKNLQLNLGEYKWVYHAYTSELCFLKGTEPEDQNITLQEFKLKIYHVDTQLRDRLYVNQLRELQKQDPNRRVFCVVGKKHRIPIEKGLKDPRFVPEVNQQDVEDIKKYIEYIKNKYKPKPVEIER